LKVVEQYFDRSHPGSFVGRQTSGEAIEVAVLRIITPPPWTFYRVPGRPDGRCSQLVRFGNAERLQTIMAGSPLTSIRGAHSFDEHINVGLVAV
jgi:hypothetical protein